MTLCIGGPLDGKQAPARDKYEDPTWFRAAPRGTALGVDFSQPPPITVTTTQYRLTPIDVLVGGTSVEAFVFVDDSMTGRDIAKGVVRLLGSLGSPA